MNHLLKLIPLFTVILIDVMGIVLVLPVLTVLILQPDSGMVPASFSPFFRDFLYGLSIALYPLFMFFSTPILGDLSDRFGRKKILMLCLFCSTISYLISSFAIEINSLIIFLSSRAIAGLAAGTQPIATAAIIDESTDQSKTKNLAWVVFVSSIGIIIGPLMGGVSAEKNIASWFSFQTPFFLAAFISILNILLLFFFYSESTTTQKPQRIHLSKGFRLFLAAFLNAKFRLLSALYFCFILAWSLYFQAINWFLMDTFHYTSSKLGFFLGYIGLIFALFTSLFVRLVLKFFKDETAAFASFVFIMGLASVAAAASQSELAQWLWVILIAGCEVMCYTFSLSIFSNQAGKEAQGWIMGVTGSLAALTWTIGGMIAGPLGYVNIRLPIFTAGALCLISFALMHVYRKNHRVINE